VGAGRGSVRVHLWRRTCAEQQFHSPVDDDPPRSRGSRASGSGDSVKQTGPRLGPSERINEDVGAWDNSLWNIVIGESGHVIMTTADDDATRRVLEQGGYRYVEGESIIAEVDDRPGGMARIARALADAGVNIHGHLFLGRWGDRAMFAFVVDRADVAKPILERKTG